MTKQFIYKPFGPCVELSAELMQVAATRRRRHRHVRTHLDLMTCTNRWHVNIGHAKALNLGYKWLGDDKIQIFHCRTVSLTSDYLEY